MTTPTTPTTPTEESERRVKRGCLFSLILLLSISTVIIGQTGFGSLTMILFALLAFNILILALLYRSGKKPVNPE